MIHLKFVGPRTMPWCLCYPFAPGIGWWHLGPPPLPHLSLSLLSPSREFDNRNLMSLSVPKISSVLTPASLFSIPVLEYSNRGFSDFPCHLRFYQEQLRLKANPHIWSCLCKRKRVDRPVTEHLRTQRRLNPQMLFLCFWSLKNICSPPPSASNVANIFQFGKGMGKIWGEA